MIRCILRNLDVIIEGFADHRGMDAADVEIVVMIHNTDCQRNIGAVRALDADCRFADLAAEVNEACLVERDDFRIRRRVFAEIPADRCIVRPCKEAVDAVCVFAAFDIGKLKFLYVFTDADNARRLDLIVEEGVVGGEPSALARLNSHDRIALAGIELCGVVVCVEEIIRIHCGRQLSRIGDAQIRKLLGAAADFVGNGSNCLIACQTGESFDRQLCGLVIGRVVHAVRKRHADLAFQRLDRFRHLEDMRTEGLLLVIRHRPAHIERDDLDLNVLALHILRDIAGIGIRRKDFVVCEVEIVCAVLCQLLLGRSLRGVHMELIVLPLLRILRQAVLAVGRCQRIVRIDGVDIGIAVRCDIPDTGAVVVLIAHIRGIDIVGAGEHAELLAVFVNLPPLIVEVEDLDVADVIGHTGLAVDDIDRSRLACLREHIPLNRREVMLCIGAFGFLDLILREAAEKNRGFGLGGRELIAEETVALVVNAHILLDRKDDAVHLARLIALPVEIRAAVHNLTLDRLQRELALERIIAGSVHHGNQRLINAVGAGFADILARQRIHTVDLVGEELHIRADAVMLVVVVLDRVGLNP